MIFERFLSELDHDRVEQSLHKLARHDISRWALTGGFATELHIEQHAGKPAIRCLHDIDFVVRSFDCIPESLGRDFLLRHIHPYDPPGKTLVQCVDPGTGVRIDVFRAYGSVMDRVLPITLSSRPLGMISLRDLTARAARLCWDLSGNALVSPKYVKDFLRLLELVETHSVEAVWQEHRKPHSLESFAETARELHRLVASRSDLLIVPTYSTDVNASCERCRDTAALRLANPGRILSLLGYC
jgi:hypothetical protein